MKTSRILVVVLLAVLLPLRGAVAATMLCGAPGEASEVAAPLHAHGHQVEHADHVGHAMHQGQHVHGMVSDASPSHHDGTHGHADRCHLCAGGCCTTPLAMASPEVLEPLLTAKVVFPTLSEAVPAFQSEGQERPPRSI